MKSENSRATLLDIMAAHQLKRADVARLLGLVVRKSSHGTVDAWLSGRRNIPASKLELLQIKVSRAPV